MPIYELEGPDGKIYEIEGPAGATAEELGQFIMSQQGAQGEEGPPVQKEEPLPQVKDRQDAKRVLRNIANPFVSAGKLVLSGLSQAPAVGESLIEAGQRVSEGLGAGRSKVFDEAVSGSRAMREQAQKYWQKDSTIAPESVAGQIYQGIGATPAAAVQWNPAITATEAFAEGGAGAVPGAVAERALLGKGLGMVAEMPGGEITKRAVTGTLMGAHGYGKTGDVEGAVANAALGMMMPQKKVTVAEAGGKRYVEGKRDFTDKVKEKYNEWKLPEDASPVERKYAARVEDTLQAAMPNLGGETVGETIRAYGDKGSVARAVRDIYQESKRGAVTSVERKSGEIITRIPKTYDELFQSIQTGKQKALTKYESAMDRVNENPEALTAFRERLPEVKSLMQEIADSKVNLGEKALTPTARAALESSLAFEEFPPRTPREMQDRIKALNEFLEGSEFTEQHGVKSVAQRRVEKYREILTDITGRFDGPEWKQNRDLYGGYSALEKSVVPIRNQIIVAENSPGKSKIITPTAAGELAIGTVSGRGTLAALGLANVGISAIRAKGKHPDTRVRNMFDKIKQEEMVRKAIGRRTARRAPMTQGEIENAD